MSTKSRRKKSKLINAVLIVWFLISFLLFAFSGYKLYIWFVDNKNTEKNIEEIDDVQINEVEEDNTELVNEEIDKSSDYWYYITFPLFDVNINELKNKNSDTIGWINVNNTNINYPFVQTSDNSYYLNHSYNKEENEAGWVFMDYRNDSNLDNKNTILYAHSRLDKTMFGSLSKVFSSSWQNNKDNHIIRLSTENENTLWQIFSVYKIKTESYYITTDFYSDSEYLDFLNTIKDRSIYDFNTSLNTDDRLLTLSTCYSDTEKTVVHAKLIKRSYK